MNEKDKNRHSSHSPMTPQQRRAAARRRAQRARQLRRRRIFWLCLLLAIVLALVVSLIRRGMQHTKPNSESLPAASSVAQQISSSAVGSQPTSEPQPAGSAQNTEDGEWQMRLVNANSPLPEGYVPPLSEIPNASGRQFDSRAIDALRQMLADGNAQGLSLMVCSAYRSVERQDALFESMQQDYMSQGYSKEEAYRITATIRAPHGCSEHSSGLAADIVSIEYQTLDNSFGDTPEAKWLAEHCAEYGFILRYPKDKQEVTGIIYEPWHFRYVGVENAQKIKDSGLCLEEYLA